MSLNESEALSRSDLIAKLKKINSLYQVTAEIEEEMEDFIPLDTYDREIEVPPFPDNRHPEKKRKIRYEDIDHSDDAAINTIAYRYDSQI